MKLPPTTPVNFAGKVSFFKLQILSLWQPGIKGHKRNSGDFWVESIHPNTGKIKVSKTWSASQKPPSSFIAWKFYKCIFCVLIKSTLIPSFQFLPYFPTIIPSQTYLFFQHIIPSIPLTATSICIDRAIGWNMGSFSGAVSLKKTYFPTVIGVNSSILGENLLLLLC